MATADDTATLAMVPIRPMSLAQLFFVERWAGVVSGQNALQGRVRLLDLHHGIVDQLADGHLLGVLLQKRPAGLFGLG